MTVLVIFDADDNVIVVLKGDSYYLHNNAEILRDEQGGSRYEFSTLEEAK